MQTLEQYNDKQVAEYFMKKGIAIIPLLPKEKKNWDKDILTKNYNVVDLIPNGNVGINLKKSNLACYDADTSWSIKFAKRWISNKTREHGRVDPEGNIETTHYIFINNGGMTENLKDRDVSDHLMDHNLVVYGATYNKKTNKWYKKCWVKECDPTPLNDSVRALFHQVDFASALAPHIKFLNKGNLALKIDSCLKLYCTHWSDSQRLEFLMDFYSVVMPDSKDVKESEFNRKIRSNNDPAKNNAGYKALASSINVDPLEVKKWFSWIGAVPDDLKYEKKKTYKDFASTGVDMKALMKKVLPPIAYAVQDILPEGLALLAGVPKAMKSFTALMLLYKVQNGEMFFGYQGIEGDCLGIFLEDGERRLKDRVQKMELDKSKSHPTIATEAPYLGFGLEESLQDWIDSVKKPRLIVIDTLARVKKIYGGKNNKTAYDVDNELLNDLQKLAIKNNVTIMLVTHLTKAETEYNFNRIQGSVGMQGMCDSMWLLDRGDTSGSASVVGRGRDMADFQLALKWSSFCWAYQVEGSLPEIHKRENREQIINAMEQLKKKGMTEVAPRDVIKFYHYNHNSKDARRIAKNMQRMKEDHELVDGEEWGTYKSRDASPPPFSNKKQEARGIDFEADAKITKEMYAKGEFKRTKRPPIN